MHPRVNATYNAGYTVALGDVREMIEKRKKSLPGVYSEAMAQVLHNEYAILLERINKLKYRSP